MATTSKQTILALASVGIDIGKDVFHIVGFDPDGKIVLRRKIKCLALVREFENLPPGSPQAFSGRVFRRCEVSTFRATDGRDCMDD